jgi:hypothetical protein
MIPFLKPPLSRSVAGRSYAAARFSSFVVTTAKEGTVPYWRGADSARRAAR